MAGSSEKKQTTTKKSANSNANKKTTTAKTKSTGSTKAVRNNQTKRNTKSVNKQEDVIEESFRTEVVVWILCAVMLILELGNFELCGFVNRVSSFFFGVFGIIEYVVPLAVMFAAFFLHINEYKKRAVNKVILGSIVLLLFGVIGQLVAGVDNYSFVDIFLDGFDNKIGGGVICGSLAFLLYKMVGLVGTYIIIVLLIILCVVLFAEFSVIKFMKETAVMLANTEEADDDIEVEDMPRKRQKAFSNKSKDFEEIAREDYPDSVDPIFKERKKSPSVLEAISVLPAEQDKGIIPSKTVDKIPDNEEVHEITMDYELDLPGKHMDEFDIEQQDKQVVKEIAKPKRKTKKKPNVVPAVLPNDEAIIDTSEASKAESEAVLNMENKTVKAEKNVSAKVVAVSESDYKFPPLELLKRGKTQSTTKEDSIRANAIKLQEVLKSFGVNVTMTNYSCGPSVTRYEMVPEQGVKVSKITGLADDIMMNLAAQSIRIEAPIPGKSAVGIEIPNGTRSGVGFRELIDTEKFIKHPSKIAFAVGKDIEGNVVVEDIAKMPHLLIAGATGSGKSVCTNTLIMSILYKAHPDEVKLILVDPKQVELKVYNGIPHLLTPVVTDPKKAAGALNWAVAEMTKRYQIFSEQNVRNIQGYNARVKELEGSAQAEEEKLEKMPQIVIIVDELADLMMVAKAEVEEAIVRLAQLARAAGIHLVIATQRPSVDVVTGLIKANVPSRIALSVSSGVDSRTIIDSVGAEKLLGNGDMLFYPTMYPKPVRVQGAYISDDEVTNVVEFLKAQNGETSYNEEVTNQITASVDSSTATAIGVEGANEQDEYFVQAGRFIIEKNKASIGMLQRMFKIGFNRAARIMDQLFEAGVVGPEEGTKPRQVIMSEEQFEEYIDEYF